MGENEKREDHPDKARRRCAGAAASVLAASALAGIASPAWSAAAAGRAEGGTANAAVGAPAPVPSRTLLVLGDSLSAEYGLARGSGWVAMLADRLTQRKPAWTVVNASISGETTSGGAARISDLLDRHRPAAVIVELGGNDALRGLDLKATRTNLERIVGESLKADAKVLMLGIQVPPNYGRAYTEALAKVFDDVARAQQVPLVPFFLEGVADDMSLFQSDRIHPNDKAQPQLLKNVWPALEPLLG